jgi:uncharacterized protein (TIGR01777 family)
MRRTGPTRRGIYGEASSFPGNSALKVAITGANGLIGGALSRALRNDGDEIIAIPRGGSDLGDADAVVHLSGSPIAVRWNAQRKREIRTSRVLSTQRIADAIDATKRPPRVFICASAIGIYGDRGTEVLTEKSASADDYLAGVVREWEAAARATRVRSVQLRFGIVLSPEGGALAKMLPVFRMGLGGRLATGAQWMSWIGLHDLVRVIRFAIASADINGAVNAVAPVPVTNAEFTATLGRVLHRPAVVPVPAAALHAIFGEMASLTMLASQRVKPARLEQAGFPFEYPDLEGALIHELSASH